ncbi:Com family DNA-binding transcriptional regulator [Pseudomonas graminis]
MQEIRCGQCGRKLAMVSAFVELQIKCPRCSALNHFRNQSSGLDRN